MTHLSYGIMTGMPKKTHYMTPALVGRAAVADAQKHDMLVETVLEYFNNGGDMKKAIRDKYFLIPVQNTDVFAKKLANNKDIKAIAKIYASRALHRVEFMAQTARSEKVRLDANITLLDRSPDTKISRDEKAGSNNVLVIQLAGVLAEKNGITAGTPNVVRVDDAGVVVRDSSQ